MQGARHAWKAARRWCAGCTAGAPLRRGRDSAGRRGQGRRVGTQRSGAAPIGSGARRAGLSGLCIGQHRQPKLRPGNKPCLRPGPTGQVVERQRGQELRQRRAAARPGRAAAPARRQHVVRHARALHAARDLRAQVRRRSGLSAGAREGRPAHRARRAWHTSCTAAPGNQRARLSALSAIAYQ